MYWTQLFWSVVRVFLLPLRACLYILRWILKVLAALLRGLAVVVKPAMRFLTYLFFIIAAVSFVSDLTPALNGIRDYASTTLGEHWKVFAPRALEAAKLVVTNRLGAWSWESVLEPLLNMSTTFLFALLGCLTAYAGRHKEKLEVFAN